MIPARVPRGLGPNLIWGRLHVLFDELNSSGHGSATLSP